MFTRQSLFQLRNRLNDIFFDAPDEKARQRAFDGIWYINKRLLRGSWR